MSFTTTLQTFPKQTQFRREGEVGNCWQYCIAAILNLPPEEVPHFLKESIANDTNMDFDTQKWLNKRGLWMAHTRDLHFYRDCDSPLYIVCGPSPRSKELHQHHAVVMQNYRMVYDPHPDNTGLTAEIDYYLIFKPPTGERSEP
jgi:hypothetical protein